MTSLSSWTSSSSLALSPLSTLPSPGSTTMDWTGNLWHHIYITSWHHTTYRILTCSCPVLTVQVVCHDCSSSHQQLCPVPSKHHPLSCYSQCNTCERTSRSLTRTQVLTKLVLSNASTGGHARGPSRNVRPEPQQDWSSREPQSKMRCTNFCSRLAFSKAFRNGK